MNIYTFGVLFTLRIQSESYCMSLLKLKSSPNMSIIFWGLPFHCQLTNKSFQMEHKAGWLETEAQKEKGDDFKIARKTT